MREIADSGRIRRFMTALAQAASKPADVYLVGGATAVLEGWRDSTIDVDLKLVPENDELLRAIQRLKEELRINVELASPDQFIPVPAGWRERSPVVSTEGRLTFRHFDPAAQALAKIERGHAQDLEDVRQMLERGLVTPEVLLEQFRRLAPDLHRFPALDASSFRAAVARIAGREP